MNRGRPKISARPAMKKDLKTVENEFAGRQSQTMELKTNSTAGTMESSDIIIMLEPRTEGGIELELTSSVMQQFGKQIRKVILDTLQEYDVQNAKVEAVDKGALDCTVRARTVAAGKFKRIYPWEEGCFCGTEYRNI
mgnify:CR=1 FL=1